MFDDKIKQLVRCKLSLVEGGPSVVSVLLIPPHFYACWLNTSVSPTILFPSGILSKRLVLLRTHQLLRNLSLNCDPRDPCLALRVLAEIRRLMLERRVDLSYRPAYRREDIRRALDGLDRADSVAGADFHVDLWKLDVHDVAEGFGGVGGDAEGAWVGYQ